MRTAPGLLCCVLVLVLQQILSSSGNPVRYVVIAPQTIRPDILYNVVALVMHDELLEVSLYAGIAQNVQVLAEASISIGTNTLSTIPIKVTKSIPPGKYILTVEGRNRGVLLFRNSSELVFDPRFLSIVVQTSRPIYRAGQEVRFRVVALHTDLRPFNDGLEIYVLDPDGLIMRRWISAYTNNGVSSLRFRLPKLAKDGYWKIRIKAWNQINEQLIKVETYFDPLFEVHVMLPPYTVQSEEFISGTVSGLYTTQRIVKGNGTLTLLARDWKANHSFVQLWTEQIFFKGEAHQIQIPMSIVHSKLPALSNSNVEVKLHASVTELLSRETVEGFSHTRLIPAHLQLTFLSVLPAVFKPGLPFFNHVSVFYSDKEKVPKETLLMSRLQIQVELILQSGRVERLPDLVAGKDYQSYWIDEENVLKDNFKDSFVDAISHEQYLEEGVLKFSFDTPNNTDIIKIKAIYTSEEGFSAEANLEAVKFFSPTKKFISVQSSSTNLKVDEYAIFHIKANFILESFQYLVVSKTQIVNTGEQKMENSSSSILTLPLSLSSEMAPGFRFIVFHITDEGEILSDSCFLPVDGFTKFDTELEINTGKDHKAERVEMRASGGVGAFIGAHAVRAEIYKLQAGNEISLARIIEGFMLFENSTRQFNKMHWKSRDGSVADHIQYFMSMDYGHDSNKTFSSAGLVIFSSQNIYLNSSQGICNTMYELPCDSTTCYPMNKTCDGVLDCPSGYDEVLCAANEKEEFEYKISRISRHEFLYDMREADWGWREIKVNDHEGVEFEPLTAPVTGDDWYFTAFSISNERGFSMISEPFIFSSKRNFMMHLTGPSSCFTGEQVSLQLDLINNHEAETLVMVTLKGSPDYKFVNVEEGGKVASYSARLTSGDHQLLVYLAPQSQEHIDFPVAPTVEQGAVEIVLTGAAQTGVASKTHSLEVHGGGALVNKHTSVFLDLKNRALVMTYLDIVVEETPIIPYSMNRRYVYGSTSASVSVFGDLIGPAFSTVPATIESTLRSSAKGTLARVFEFGVNIWTLHYLHLTNKLQRPFLKEVLLECNTIYAEILKRFHPSGAFTNWDASSFSVWLTAWTLRLLKAATYPDWEFLLYIDPSVADKGVAWLLQYQSANGSFFDESATLDSKLNTHEKEVTLTAQVLITLCECMALVTGEVKIRAAIASQRAATYLDYQLSSLTDPYPLALAMYALGVSMGRGDVEHGYHSLMEQQRRNSEGFIYWSPGEIPANPIKKENQRPFVKPRLYHEEDSVAVETTAWILLIILHREGVTDTADKIVQWLNSIRMTTGGFISPVDTLVALQALTEYAFRARLHEVTNMDVTVEFPMSGNKRNKVHIDNSSILFQTEMQIPKVWGNVILVAQGAGQAVAQLDVNYGIDNDLFLEVPTIPSFALNVTEYYSTYRNKTALTIQSCFRWLRSQPPTSSAATLEVDTPTGYHLVESEAERVARLGSHPSLQDALVTSQKTVWFFEQVGRDWTCFNYTVKRWFPVANMSLHRQALLYEATARERFVQVLVNSTPLHVLNICEVCGSFQCPYCPNYNIATSVASCYLLVIFSFIVLVVTAK